MTRPSPPSPGPAYFLGPHFRILCRDLLARHKHPPPNASAGVNPLAATKVAPERFLLEERVDFGVRDRVLRRVGDVFLRDIPGRAVLDDLWNGTQKKGGSRNQPKFNSWGDDGASRG
jgi:hypothetical protein